MTYAFKAVCSAVVPNFAFPDFAAVSFQDAVIDEGNEFFIVFDVVAEYEVTAPKIRGTFSRFGKRTHFVEILGGADDFCVHRSVDIINRLFRFYRHLRFAHIGGSGGKFALIQRHFAGVDVKAVAYIFTREKHFVYPSDNFRVRDKASIA